MTDEDDVGVEVDPFTSGDVMVFDISAAKLVVDTIVNNGGACCGGVILETRLRKLVLAVLEMTFPFSLPS